MNSMTLLDSAIFFAASAAGGAINSVAGGGTFITFPVLILNGLSALQANIMSTIALWPGSISSAWAYHRELNVEKQNLVQFMFVSMLGSIIGTAILLLTPEVTFARLVPWLLLAATLIFTFGRYGIRWLHQFSGTQTAKYNLAAIILQFLIGIYGGYFGAGIGILMLAMLQIMGLNDIHKMNAFKTILGSTINAIAVIVFILAGRVMWDLAAVMIIGAIIGGYLGAKWALKIPPETVRSIVSIIGFAMTIYFFARTI